MKKKLTLLLATLVLMVNQAFAQNKLVATLQHGDATTFYYGGAALQSAHDAAVDGDIITLSDGIFHQATLSKSVTVRGAGMRKHQENGTEATVIENITFAADTKNVMLEGVCINSITAKTDEKRYPNVKDIQFIKCKLAWELAPEENSSYTLINCIAKNITIDREQVSVSCINSYVENGRVLNSSGGINFENCVVGYAGIYYEYENESESNVYYNTYNNCILFALGNNAIRLPATATCSNSVVINIFNEEVDPFERVSKESNSVVHTANEIFSSFNIEVNPEDTNNLIINCSESETFELTDSARTTYLGGDGAQVGIYGGIRPFTTVLSYPQFTKATVAKEAVDGKLSVNIEINGGE